MICSYWCCEQLSVCILSKWVLISMPANPALSQINAPCQQTWVFFALFSCGHSPGQSPGYQRPSTKTWDVDHFLKMLLEYVGVCCLEDALFARVSRQTARNTTFPYFDAPGPCRPHRRTRMRRPRSHRRLLPDQRLRHREWAPFQVVVISPQPPSNGLAIVLPCKLT